MDLKAVIAGVGFALMWSSAFSSARLVVLDAPPLAALSVRFLISGLIAVSIAAVLGQSARLSRAHWIAVILFGICQNALYLGLTFVALQTIEAVMRAIFAGGTIPAGPVAACGPASAVPAAAVPSDGAMVPACGWAAVRPSAT